MRLWSLHPQYLDAKGLVALWREALLAQAVLTGLTRGYLHHPQLLRFRQHPDPLQLLAAYLWGVHAEAVQRGYNFSSVKILSLPEEGVLEVTSGQLHYEAQHLCSKLQQRDPLRFQSFKAVRVPLPHPLFTVVPGDVAVWEKVQK